MLIVDVLIFLRAPIVVFETSKVWNFDGGEVLRVSSFHHESSFSSIPCVDVSISSYASTDKTEENDENTRWLLVLLLLSHSNTPPSTPCMEGVRAESCNRGRIIAPGSAACITSSMYVRAHKSQFRSIDYSSSSACCF